MTWMRISRQTKVNFHIREGTWSAVEWRMGCRCQSKRKELAQMGISMRRLTRNQEEEVKKRTRRRRLRQGPEGEG